MCIFDENWEQFDRLHGYEATSQESETEAEALATLEAKAEATASHYGNYI